MAKCDLHEAKYIVTVVRYAGRVVIQVVGVLDNKTNVGWSDAMIAEYGISQFLNKASMKKSLNLKLNGNAKKYYFKWGPTANGRSIGWAYIFD